MRSFLKFFPLSFILFSTPGLARRFLDCSSDFNRYELIIGPDSWDLATLTSPDQPVGLTMTCNPPVSPNASSHHCESTYYRFDEIDRSGVLQDSDGTILAYLSCHIDDDGRK